MVFMPPGKETVAETQLGVWKKMDSKIEMRDMRRLRRKEG